MKIKKHALTFLVFCLGLLGQLTHAASLDYQTKELDNHMKLVYKTLPDAQTTAVRIVIPAGFLDEAKEVSNISHLLEHLIYRGSDKYSSDDFERQIVERGGRYNGFTMLDRTEYLLEMAAADFVPGLALYLDQIFHPCLRDEDIELEKKIITVEKVMRDNPGNIFYCYLNELTSKQLSETVNRITRADLVDYHQRHYRPEQVTVIITGNFELKEIVHVLTGVNASPSGKKETAMVWQPGAVKDDLMLEDYLQGEEYQLLYSFALPGLSRKDLLVAKVLPYIFSYESRNYDPVTGRALDYDMGVINLKEHFYLILTYRDCLNQYSPEIDDWHRKNLTRYCKLLKMKKFDKFLDNLSTWIKKEQILLEVDPALQNEYFSRKLFDPTIITDSDLKGIRSLSSGDFKTFVQKYLEGKPYQKTVIKAL